MSYLPRGAIVSIVNPPSPADQPPTVSTYFDDKYIVLTGSASGIGAAVAEALTATTAEVHTLDVVGSSIRPPKRWSNHICDLGNPGAIDHTVGQLPTTVDVVVNCAGIPNGGRFTADEVMAVNWLGLRHLTELLLERMKPGASVVHVASTAGRKWSQRTTVMQELMGADTFAAGAAWTSANADEVGDGYVLSKEAVQYYTMWRAAQLIGRGIRINSVCPGVTDTGLVPDFRRGIGDNVIDGAIAVAGRMGTPAEMASAVLFLADSNRAGYINGVNLNVDGGTAAHRQTH